MSVNTCSVTNIFRLFYYVALDNLSLLPSLLSLLPLVSNVNICIKDTNKNNDSFLQNRKNQRDILYFERTSAKQQSGKLSATEPTTTKTNKWLKGFVFVRKEIRTEVVQCC